ncbi:membrane-spanning 4-domains subfamily A member 15 isoform X2 [Triplophysa dalaica]|nr:membrane-spanning 4-domains subfamily A member 15 isoform X2 [Triplophysa dalaica]
MAENQPTGDAGEYISTMTGGTKPLHRFLRGEPKSIGIVLVFLGICLFMFGITMKTDQDTSANMYTPFWIGILFTICGILFILSERNPTKKMITASFATSIVTTIGLMFGCIDFIWAITNIQLEIWHPMGNRTEKERHFYMSLCVMEQVFLAHSLIGGVLLVTMMIFARVALRSSRTQAVVVMKNVSTVVE